MNWLDIFLALLIAGVAVVGIIRGFGRTVFDALGLYAALWAASTFAPALAAHVNLHPGGADINQCWAFGLLFLVLGASMLGMSWYAYGMTQLNAGMFDKLLGMGAGIAVGMIVAHGLVSTLVMGDPQQEASAALVAQGEVGREMLSFNTYHSVIETITGATSYRRELPDVHGK